MEDNILVFVPHQDDEIDLIGNIIDRLKKYGNIIIVYSSLDKREKQGSIRKKEAIEACKVFNIDKQNIIFLGYPDTSNKEGKHFFTDGNKRIISDLENTIIKYKPKYIFGTDFDSHSDHRMLSLAFDEAMGRVLRNTDNYFPIVMKGFCYETAYYGIEDYNATHIDICVPKYEILSNCSYEWNERYSIKGSEKNGFIWNNKVYKALRKHKSQYAILHAQSIINADNVFWQRRTDNLVFKAKVSTSSGNVDKLKDFMIIDTNDIITENPRFIDFSKGVWTPDKDDDSPKITIEFDIPKDISEIILHGNPNNDRVEKINAKIIINNKELFVEKIMPYGRNTKIKADVKDVNEIEITFDSDIYNYGLSEIEIFNRESNLNDLFVQNPEYVKQEKSYKDIINDLGYRFIVFKTKVKRKLKKIVGDRV